MSDSDRGQVNRSAAEVYDAFFVPALFQQWASRIADAADFQTGHDVLDVACGTGVLTRTVAERVGPTGEVIGLDNNEDMLTVAQRKAPHIRWQHGKAEALPFDDASFDVVVSQFGLMFFEDRAVAIQEMTRVLKPDGRLVVAVWDSLTNTPGYAAMVELLQRLFGHDIANGLRAPYVLGDTQQLRSLFNVPELVQVDILTQQGHARFPSIESWVHTDIKGWTLADQIDDTQYTQLLHEAKTTLSHFVGTDGEVIFSAPAHIVVACKRSLVEE
ncbi:MAG: class I SAM-dependent methyltransferase [Anaerolineae bacterium]